MNPIPITVVGTPQAFWTQHVQQMLSRLEHVSVHAEMSSADAQSDMVCEPAPSRTLVLVEHPVVGLARMLSEDTPQPPRIWLDEWLSNGRALLAHAQRDPSACLLVNADDARRQPQRLSAMLRDTWGESLTLPSEVLTIHKSDPLATALAASFVDQHLSVQEVADELLASCVILPGDEPLLTTLSPRSLGDGEAASRRLAELFQSERAFAQTVDALESTREAMHNDVAAGTELRARHARTAEELVAERDTLRSELAAALVVQVGLERNVTSVEAECVGLKDELSVSVRTGEQMQRRLQELRTELDQMIVARRDSQLALSAMKFERDLHAGQAEEVARQLGAEQVRIRAHSQEILGVRMQVAALEDERARVERDLCESQERGVRLDCIVEASVAERDTLRNELARSKQEGALIRQQLQQMGEELERRLFVHRESVTALSTARAECESQAKQVEEAAGLLSLEKAHRVVKAQEIHGLQTQLEHLVDALQRFEQDLHASKEEVGLLSKQLHDVQNELQHVSDARRAAESDLQALKAGPDGRKLEQELLTAKEEGNLLLQNLSQLQEELESMFVARRGAETALAALKAGPDGKKLELELLRAREDNELLTLQMNQVQQELERVHQEKMQFVRTAKERIELPYMEDIAIGEVTLMAERNTPPHREASFVVRSVRAGQRWVAEAAVRLVEHWGRPGLAVFAVDGQAPLFQAWQESGREDSRPYMLLVHGEESAQRTFDAMGTLDWQLVQALAVRLRQALLAPEASAEPAWVSLGQRLLTSLQEQPARLRHEGVRVMPIAQQSPEVARWGLVMERASYKGRIWPRLTIQWRPIGPHASLDLVRDEEGGPPLLAWPADGDGFPARALRLPVGGDPGTSEVRNAWAALCPADKAFVGEVLNLMPMLAVHVQASIGTEATGASTDLQAAARSAMAVGRAAMGPALASGSGAPAPLLRRVARRLRAAAHRNPD